MVLPACERVFQSFDVRTLIGYHHAENERSAALLRRLGFRVQAALDFVPPHLAGIVRRQVLLTLNRPD
jgi:RimJ/RimL family protein N-acetyltransferase